MPHKAVRQVMEILYAFLENIRTSLPKEIRYGLISLLSVLTIVFLFVAGGLSNNLILGLIITFIIIILLLALEPRKSICGILVFAFFCIALYLRVGPSHDAVFVGDLVKFQGNDPWYHMRLTENLVHNFPQRISFDPYTIYPTGMKVQFAPFFDLLLGFVIWVVGWGHPDVSTIETVGAYFPAVLGALVIVPVYFIGKSLFNRTAGLVAAALLAIMPGEFFFRSMLGFTDHHIAETLFSTTAVLFLILAVKSARARELTFSHVRGRDWGSLRTPLIYSLLAGLALGVYLLSWVGGLLFVLMIIIYVIIQYIIDHLRGTSTDYLCIIGVPIFIVSLIVISPLLDVLRFGDWAVWALAFTILAFPVLNGASRLMAHIKLNRNYYPVVVILLVLAAVGIFSLIEPSIYQSVVKKFGLFSPSVKKLTIMEVQPLFRGFDISTFAGERAWRYFTTGLFLVPISLLLLVYSVVKGKIAGKISLIAWGLLVLMGFLLSLAIDMPAAYYLAVSAAILLVYFYYEKRPERVLLFVWSAVVLVAILGQTRFAYYFAVNVALLVGYFCWKIPGWVSIITGWIGSREVSHVDARKLRKAEKRGETPKESRLKYVKSSYVSVTLSVVIVFLLAFYPLIGQVTRLSRNPFSINDGWYGALVWMRENTPEPFEDPGFYYELYERPPKGEGYEYPESAYGVMSWWDYGHWITRIAHRIPNANPHQLGIGGLKKDGSLEPGASTFFTAQDETSASEILDELGSEYVVIDIEMDTSKYPTMVTWAGENTSDFFSRYYYITEDGSPDSVVFYHERYYRSMCSRLFNFEAQEVVPNGSTYAIAYTEAVGGHGEKYRRLSGIANGGRPFSTYEEAKAFVDANTEFVIVGIHPLISPVPLEKLERYSLIHGSDYKIDMGGFTTSYVKIFDYVP